ncbi:MAG TPA: Crp/Fnr family transcriptional regulator [Pyrinomonadaceae bacterium]|nr:Crp/Fnr family transcriptional regulator [Pyrinomonadaceae bacterium]
MSQISEHFSAELTESLFALGSRRSFRGGEHVFFEGDQATFLPIILAGKIKMVRYPEAGKEIIIGMFQAGEIFAIPPAMDGKQFPATAVAIVDSSLLMVPRNAFLALMDSSSEFSSLVLNRMCGILRDRADTVQIMATPSAEQRIATVLLRLTGEMNGNETTKITHRRQDIAEMAGLTLETTIRTIRKLADKGSLKIIGGRIFVETTEHLRALVR